MLIITYHIDIIIIMPYNNIIDLIVSLLTAAYSINRRLFFTNVLCCLYESTDNSTFVKNNLRFIE